MSGHWRAPTQLGRPYRRRWWVGIRGIIAIGHLSCASCLYSQQIPVSHRASAQPRQSPARWLL